MYSPDDPTLFEEVLVSPRYLAGSNGSGELGLAPVAHWPRHDLDDGPCQLVVTSPDHRIRIGWFGDDLELWKISAADDPVSAARWTATFNHVTPPEIVAGLTSALARDYAQADPFEDNVRFLGPPSIYWADGIRPLTDAGWQRTASARDTVEIIAPDGQAGVRIDNRHSGWHDETITLWAGPKGWGTRAEAVFTAGTPSHLIAATAAAMADPTPVIRERHTLRRDMEHLVTLTPVAPDAAPRTPRAPTPLDVRRTGVAQAVQRAALTPRTAADLRVMAAQSRSTGAPQNQSSSLVPPVVLPAVASPARRSR